MEQIHRIKSITLIATILPFTVLDLLIQRWGLWHLWLDNIVSIVASCYAVVFLFYRPARRIAKYVFICNSILMIIHIAIYSVYSPGWPMYSAAIALWAYFFAMFESSIRASKNLFITIIAILLIYNSYYQTDLTSTERWLNQGFTLARISTAFFMVLAGGMINYVSIEYERISNLKLQNKESRISFQNDLFSILAHNIRTPLATLTMQFELAKLREQESVELEKTELPLKQLELTINSLLDNRKATKSESKLSLSELIVELGEHHQSLIIDSSNVVDKDIEVEFGLVMALDSFVSNATKFDSTPKLYIAGNHELIFTLTDRGGGMTSVDFQEYGNPVLSKSRGLGIGVHLSKEILSHLGYRCEVGNTENLGISIRIYRLGSHIENMKALEHAHLKILC